MPPVFAGTPFAGRAQITVDGIFPGAQRIPALQLSAPLAAETPIDSL